MLSWLLKIDPFVVTDDESSACFCIHWDAATVNQKKFQGDFHSFVEMSIFYFFFVDRIGLQWERSELHDGCSDDGMKRVLDIRRSEVKL
jgi:hypothetical protein